MEGIHPESLAMQIKCALAARGMTRLQIWKVADQLINLLWREAEQEWEEERKR